MHYLSSARRPVACAPGPLTSVARDRAPLLTGKLLERWLFLL